jgi:Ca2+/Na+ antiporter
MDDFADTRRNRYPGLKGFAYASSERPMLQNIGLILAGLAILIVGAQLLVKGASRLALALGIAPLIVGLTIVAFGTSAPELAVSIQSSLAEKTDLLLGNAVGSNIYNVLFILGVCATITPLAVAPQLIRLDVPIMVGAALTLLLMAQDKVLDRLDGAILIGALVAYTLFVIVQSRKEKTGVKNDYAEQIDESGPPFLVAWSVHSRGVGVAGAGLRPSDRRRRGDRSGSGRGGSHHRHDGGHDRDDGAGIVGVPGGGMEGRARHRRG